MTTRRELWQHKQMVNEVLRFQYGYKGCWQPGLLTDPDPFPNGILVEIIGGECVGIQPHEGVTTSFEVDLPQGITVFFDKFADDHAL